MAYSDKKQMEAYVNNRNREKYDRIGVMAPKGEGDTIKAAAASAKISTNAYILEAVREKMSRDGGGAAPETEDTVEVAQTPAEHAQTLTEAKRMVRAAGNVILPSLLRESVAEASRAAGETDDAFLWRAVSGQAEQDRGKRKAAVNVSNAPQGILIPVVVSLPLDELERIQAAAEAAGEGVTDFIRHTIEARSRGGAKGRQRQ